MKINKPKRMDRIGLRLAAVRIIGNRRQQTAGHRLSVRLREKQRFCDGRVTEERTRGGRRQYQIIAKGDGTWYDRVLRHLEVL